MNDIPDCSRCERCKSMEYLFDDFYCCEENEPSQIYGLLGVYCPPEVSPIWCPKKVKENEEVMRNIDTKATRENISKDLNNLGENRTENIGDLKVGLFGSLDMNRTRKKIKNLLAKLSL